MIRELKNIDSNALLDIWIDGLSEYSGKSKLYWEEKENILKEYLNNNYIIVYVEETNIVGFIILEDKCNIIALFVKKEFRNKSVGTALLDWVKEENDSIFVSITDDSYAVKSFFYKNGFDFKYEQMDFNTGIKESFYEWRRKNI